MDIQYFDEPWRHAVIDNFLPEDLFNKILESQEEIYAISDEHFSPESQTRLMLEHGSQTTNIVGHNILPERNKKTKDIILSKFDMYGLRNLIDDFNHFLEENIAPVYESLKGEPLTEQDKSNIYSGIQIQPPGFKFQIHDESYIKKISIVLFVAPEDNHGTLLYKSPEQDYYDPTKKIEWKQNRAFIFCGESGVTWHSFYAKDGAQKRYTIGSFVRVFNWKELKENEQEIASKKHSVEPSEYEQLKLKFKENAKKYKELGRTND